MMLALLESLEKRVLWDIPVFKNGEFFTQTVFAVMSSIACSSRVLDFFVVKHNEDVDSLRREIKIELEEEPLFEEQNKQYSESQLEIEDLLSKVDNCVANAVEWSRKVAVISVLVTFVLLATGEARFVGWLPLLAFVPIVIIRVRLGLKVNPLNSKLEAKGEHFKGLRKAYNTMKNKIAAKAGSKVDAAIAVKVPKKTPRKKKLSDTSHDSA